MMVKRIVNRDLFQKIISEVPAKFLNELPLIQSRAYNEAYQIVSNDSSFEEPEAQYLLPHIRRAEFERLFRARALDCGLRATVESTRKNSKYTLVRSGRFLLTASFAHYENEIVRHAQFREQHSSLNHLLAQMTMFGSGIVHNPNDLYGIVLHGSDNNPDESEAGFLRLAFPSPDTKEYADNFNIYDLIALTKSAETSTDEFDIAIPTPKRRKDVQGA